VSSEITNSSVSQDAGSTSEITTTITKRGPGARPTTLAGEFAQIIEDYAAALDDAPLSVESRRTYLSRVRMYLAWLAEHRPTPATTGDPITSPSARDWAVRDYRRWLLRDGPDKRSVVYANSALTAIDDFYTRRGLGKARIDRDELPATAPRALDETARIRWLRAVEAHLSPPGPHPRTDPLLHRRPNIRSRRPRCRRPPALRPQSDAANLGQSRHTPHRPHPHKTPDRAPPVAGGAP